MISRWRKGDIYMIKRQYPLHRQTFTSQRSSYRKMLTLHGFASSASAEHSSPVIRRQRIVTFSRSELITNAASVAAMVPDSPVAPTIVNVAQHVRQFMNKLELFMLWIATFHIVLGSVRTRNDIWDCRMYFLLGLFVKIIDHHARHCVNNFHSLPSLTLDSSPRCKYLLIGGFSPQKILSFICLYRSVHTTSYSDAVFENLYSKKLQQTTLYKFTRSVKEGQ